MTSLTHFLTDNYALAWLIIVPLLASVLLMIMPRTWELTIRLVAVSAGFITLIISSLLMYDYWTLIRQGAIAVNAASDYSAIWRYDNPALAKLITFGPISFHLATDGAGVAMCLLTAITIVAGIFASWNLQTRSKEYLALLLLLVSGVFGVFVASDLFFFFLFYEIAVLPMYLLIGIWGTGQKEYSAMKLTLMLLMGSAFISVGFLALYAKSLPFIAGGTFDLLKLQAISAEAFNGEFSRWFFLAFYLGFGVLAGIFPFHTWSPDGHASAPTATSMPPCRCIDEIGWFWVVACCCTLIARWYALLALAYRNCGSG